MKNTILLITSTLLFIQCQPKKAVSVVTSDEVIPVTTTALLTAANAEGIETSGLVGSLGEARLAFKTGGVIQKMFVREGDRIRKGQLLATLNLSEINAQVAQAKEATAKAERDLKRVTALYQDSVATYEQVQNLTTALRVAENNVQIAEFNRGYSEIRSPINGVIVRKLANEGELTAPGSPLFFVNATGPTDWVVKVGVPDRDWVRLREGSRAEIRLDAYPKEVFAAVVSNLSAGAEQTSGLYQVEVRFARSPEKLATGIFGKVKLYPTVVNAGTTVAIPADALIEGENQDGFVYVMEGNFARKKAVKIQGISKDKVLISSGLEGYSEVITEGSAYLTDGAKIKIMQQK